MGWGLYNTLDASNAIEVLERAIKAHGAPEIINSDLGTVPGQPLDRALLEDHQAGIHILEPGE